MIQFAMRYDKIGEQSELGKLEKKNILITGTTGFIGKNLLQQLKEKYNIYCPVRSELDLLETESVFCYLTSHNIDIVIHSANTNTSRAQNAAIEDSLDRNLRMFYNLERCKNCFGKMYYFGSGAEYDMQHYIPRMKEDYFGTYIPKDPYGFSKYIMSKSCEQKGNIYDLRLFGVFGKYEEWERRFISNAICRALTGKDITIRKNVYFDYLWVEDLCQMMEWFIESEPRYRHYNVCRGNKIDLYSLACIVREALNIDCNIVVKEKGWKPEYTGDNERLLREIGDFHFNGMKESIRKLCDYYKDNIDIIEEEKLI